MARLAPRCARLPRRRASTPSFRPISAGPSFCPLKAKADLLEMTLQPRKARELVDQALGDPVAQVVVGRVAGRVLERENGHRPDRGSPAGLPVQGARHDGDGRDEDGRSDQEKAPALPWRRSRPQPRSRRPVPLQVAQVDEEVAGRGVTAVAVLLEALADDALELGGNVVSRPREGLGSGVADLVDRLGGRVPDERKAADGQLVEDDAEAEEVGPVVDLLAERLLRAHVGHGAHDEPGLRPGLRLDPAVERGRALQGLAREAEVEELHLPVRRDHGVGGLDVAVDDAARVGLLQRRGHLLPEVDDPVHVERAAREKLAQVLALDVLHGDEVRPLVDADVVDVRDVRVVEGRSGARLALEPLAVDLVDGQLRREHLDRDGPLQPRVPRPVDLSHPSGPDGAEDLVRAESPAGRQLHGSLLARIKRAGWYSSSCRSLPSRCSG